MFSAKDKIMVNFISHYNKLLKNRTEAFLKYNPDTKDVLIAYFANTGFNPLNSTLPSENMTGVSGQSLRRFQEQRITRETLHPQTHQSGRKTKKVPEWTLGPLIDIIASKIKSFI